MKTTPIFVAAAGFAMVGACTVKSEDNSAAAENIDSTPTMTANESDFSVNADPEPSQAPETTGGRHFYLDSTDNAIRVNPGQRASKNDPPL